MKLKSLDLKAFGPFTSRILEFNSQGPGLHVIFGPNEAGKSSALRGLKALLFGFHPQTPDNFLHSYDQLLVGGNLENKDGQELIFQRRKKRVNDLVDGDGNPLDASLLTAFLHGVEPEIFESLYGIDHNRLVQGGNDILAQQGEVGKSLFAAGAGISSLRDVIARLEQESSDLFKPNGSRPEINKAIKRFKELQKEVKDASLAPRQWKELNKALAEAESERTSLERERDSKNKELRRLERLQRAIPELASLKVWQEHCAALGDVVTLPPDIREKHQQVEQAIDKARSQLQQSLERLKQVNEKLSGISINKVLLEQGDVVDDFHQRLGEYRKGQKDRPERNGMRINLRKEAGLLLRQVRPDMSLEEVESLRPMLLRKKTIHALSSRYEAVWQNVNQTGRRCRAAQKELEDVAGSLFATPDIQDTHELNLAVKLARKAGDIDTKIAKAQNDLEQDRTKCLLSLQRIGLWSGDLTTLLELALPFGETIQRFAQKFREISEEKRVLTKDRKDAAMLLTGAAAELKRIQYGGEVPSENDLSTTRKKRDAGWHLLRRHWLHGEDVLRESQNFDPGRNLPDAYEGLVNLADVIADRLRNEADRVANCANFKAQIEQQNEVLAGCRALEEDLDRREKNLRQEWADIWKHLGISPLSPNEMSGWLTAMEKLRYRVGDLFAKEEELNSEAKRRHELKQQLDKVLTGMKVRVPSSANLGPVLILGETLIDKIDRQKTERDRLVERRDKAQNSAAQTVAEHREAKQAFTDWQQQWQEAVAGLGFTKEISTLEAVDYLETLQNCLDKVKQATDLQKRISGIDRDAGQLEKEIQSVLVDAAPSLMDLPLDQAILQLRALLRRAQDEKTLCDQLTGEQELLQADIAIGKKHLQKANSQMAELLGAARCETADELGPVISRFLEYQKLQEKISTSEATLARIGAGMTIDELIAQAEAIDADELPGRIGSLQQDIENRIHPAINVVSQRVGEINNELAAMDGSSIAADASEKMEQELAKIRRLAGRYTRVKLASRILQQEIERYREKHQDPVLRIASDYFAELTLHSFAGLRADVNDKGEPVLEGVRPDNKWTSVNGMSDGTRDQLYLSLRLATLEWRMQTSEPMPFIVDDILINFDDDRSRATLGTLARFSRKNQVILFTHHRQLIDDAETVGKTEEVVIHML
ncbi:YhaN family protein [Desulforhopalus singaporensis]|uniref:AAA domain-containing protein n=1 Tax=Desulforhopalus singaporensis TaxID=91360 RepID=A0A1H0KP30_9BACT|nr:YhaN family protein [Desulforhopalus singaporensis]SDO57625.1 AAA domain-containing protein [Desulforhopalus singaporensis]